MYSKIIRGRMRAPALYLSLRCSALVRYPYATCVQDAIGRKEWAKAVLMSLHLNERELREKTVDAVPLSEVALTAAAVPAPYALRLLGVLADR